ncbi:MAG: hypothetical protein MUP47_06635 [Phycisphaerae bacterium]|nr:hypothetical protein [Phycisphaerae bacterium]
MTGPKAFNDKGRAMDTRQPHGLDALTFNVLSGKGSEVAQLLYPRSIERHDVALLSRLLARMETLCGAETPSVRVVVTGGGLLELLPSTGRPPGGWGLRAASDRANEAAAAFKEALSQAKRDYIIGVDVFAGPRTVGQFACVVRQGREPVIVWKSFPVGQEANYLAGFGTLDGRCSPRIVETAVGKSLILVCHDAQAFNHRNIGLVRKATQETPRRAAMNEMQRQMQEQQPEWAFNLIHQIDKPGSLRTFSTSYQQIHDDHGWSPCVVGSFGYGQDVRPDLACLAAQAQYPRGLACGIALE